MKKFFCLVIPVYIRFTRNLDEIIGVADSRNIASLKILQKVGMKFIETFTEDDDLLHWYSIKKADF